jgi:hypothetical protein
MQQRIRITENQKTKELSENLAGGQCDQQTLITYYHKEGKLIFVFVCEENSPFVYGEKNNDKLYQGDVVEVMITLGSPDKYLEIGLNPANLKYVAVVDNPSLEGNGMSVTLMEENPIETFISPTDDGYVAKILIPAEWLEMLGWDKNGALINFYRQDFSAEGELRLYAFSPTRSASFHKPKAFAQMETEY